jgi:hypothetical protein
MFMWHATKPLLVRSNLVRKGAERTEDFREGDSAKMMRS